jgi:hypothetical protein
LSLSSTYKAKALENLFNKEKTMTFFVLEKQQQMASNKQENYHQKIVNYIYHGKVLTKRNDKKKK